MSSSSEGSFEWTSASDSESGSEKKMQGCSDSESISGKKYKKKLQKELFQNGHDNIESDKLSSKVNNKTETLRETQIKLEPESDAEVVKKKKKSTQENHDESQADEERIREEDFLNMMVKKEMNFVSPKQKKKKKQDYSESEESGNISIKKEKKSKRKQSDQETVSETATERLPCDTEAEVISLSKKKKSKQENHYESQSTEERIQEEDFLNMMVKEEMNFISPKQKKKKKQDYSESEESGSISIKKEKKRRRKQSDQDTLSDTVTESLLCDTEAEVSGSSKKKKSKQENHYESQSTDERIQEEHFLNMKVKEEMNFISPKQKKKKKQDYSESEKSSNISNEKEKQRKRKHSDQETLSETVSESLACDTEVEVSGSSKKKKKHKREVDLDVNVIEYNGMIIEEKFCAEETIVQSPPKKKKKKDRHTNSEYNDKTVDEIENISKTSVNLVTEDLTDNVKNVTTSKCFRNSDSSCTHDKPNSNVRESRISDRITFEDDDNTHRKRSDTLSSFSSHNDDVTNKQSNKNKSRVEDIESDESMNTAPTIEARHHSDVSDRSTKNDTLNHKSLNNHISNERKTKISDRITFEDDDDESTHGDTNSSKLKQYLDANKDYEEVTSNLSTSNIISDSDEIWIINCPTDIDIKDLEGVDLKLDSKCKLKCGGCTYIGHTTNDVDNVAILTQNKKAYSIKNCKVSGIVKFHKRIPKAHVLDDKQIVNKQTNFIPLPETKCRHPLFGANYKQAITLSDTVTERLLYNRESSVKKEKKKKNKDKIKQEDNVDHSIKTEIDMMSKKKTHKKRKHSVDEEIPVKSKKVKKGIDTVDAWESEKAIEENLFNF